VSFALSAASNIEYIIGFNSKSNMDMPRRLDRKVSWQHFAEQTVVKVSFPNPLLKYLHNSNTKQRNGQRMGWLRHAETVLQGIALSDENRKERASQQY